MSIKTAVITKEDKWYVARCVELVSQGKSIEEAQANLREAVELYIESFGAEISPRAEARSCSIRSRSIGGYLRGALKSRRSGPGGRCQPI
jgi:predicted RNase H-like HicB family nuclease